MPHIVGTGLVAFDLIVEHRPNGRTLSASGGGTCGNVLAVLAQLDWTASWLGAIETSATGNVVRAEMKSAGVSLQAVADCDSTPAPVFVHHVQWSDTDELLQHWFSNECPRCSHELPRYARPSDEWIRRQAHQVERADVFFVDRLSAGIVDLAIMARSNGAMIVYEPSVASDAPWLDEMLAVADVVKFSQDRVAALGELREGLHSALWIETRGDQGLRWSRGNKHGRSASLPPVRNPHAIDACGAGDWFTSALLFGLAQTGSKPVDLCDGHLTQVLEAASRVAAWSCGFLGARGALYEANVQDIFQQMGTPPAPTVHQRAPLTRPVPHADLCGSCHPVGY